MASAEFNLELEQPGSRALSSLQSPPALEDKLGFFIEIRPRIVISAGQRETEKGSGWTNRVDQRKCSSPPVESSSRGGFP